MKPPLFEYVDPSTVDELLDLLSELGEDATILAGGQSLVPLLNFRLARPAHLVDINKIRELEYVRREDTTLAVGALTRQRALERDDLLTGGWSLLAEATANVGHPHIRNRGTLGGSLAHADPAAELPAAASALGATMVLRSRRTTREVVAEEFFEDVFTTAIGPDEALVEVRFPEWPVSSGAAFEEVSRRHGDFAQLGVAAVVAIDDDGRVVKAGIAIAGASAVPVTARTLADELVGDAPTMGELEQLAGDLAGALTPPSDGHGSSDYRRQLARYLVPRAVMTAMTRAHAARDVA